MKYSTSLLTIPWGTIGLLAVFGAIVLLRIAVGPAIHGFRKPRKNV